MPSSQPPTYSTQTALENLAPPQVIFGSSEAMRDVRKRMEKVAPTEVPVLIQGESGTGKELMAKLIHRWSPWQQGPFIKVNCAAIPATLVESELFGYEQGAFTGALKAKQGWAELAHRGTLFLDEIGEFDLSLQAKLLQLLQEGRFSRLGGQDGISVEARIVCATNRQLEQEIAAGTFRQDLFYRINVLTITLPPLRDRRGDIPGLADYFLELYGQHYGHRPRPLSWRVLQLMLEHDWPGNIRELENLIKTYVILDSEEWIRSQLFGREKALLGNELKVDGSLSLKKLTRKAVREMERKVILEVLQANNWNRKEAARTLNISYRSLFYKIRGSGVPRKRLQTVQRAESTKNSNPVDGGQS